MADPLQDSIVDALKASSAELFDELLSLTKEAPEELLAKIAKANKDEKLKVETSSHHEAFANLCLEFILLRVSEVSEGMLEKHHVEQDSPYLLLFSKYDYGGDIGTCYVSPEREQLEYFASHGVVNYVASQKNSEAQKKGIILALTFNPCMRKVVELTFEIIAADGELEGYLQDILRATLILQHPEGLPERMTELDLSNLFTGNMLQSEVDLVEDIWGEINAAFDVQAEDLQAAGWFIDLHPLTYTFSADGCFCEEAIRDSPSVDHILRCLELLDGARRDALCRNTIHLLLPSSRQLDEDKFIDAYQVSSHSWALRLATDDHLCLQTIYPEDMPSALEECHFEDYQSINLDFRSQNVNEESYAENLKWSLERCWSFLNQQDFATSTVKNLTVSVNNDTLLQGFIDRLSVDDENNHYSITFKGGVFHLRELKGCLTRHKMLRFQRTIIKIPDELNKEFVQRDLYKSYPYAIKCLLLRHESEQVLQSKASLGHSVPSLKNVSSGIRRKRKRLQEAGFADVVLGAQGRRQKYEAQGGSLNTPESSTSPLKPRPKCLASSIMQGAVRLDDSFNDFVMQSQAGGEKTPENSTTPLKPQLKPPASSMMQGVGLSQHDPPLVVDLDGEEDYVSTMVTSEKGRRRLVTRLTQAQSQYDLLFNQEPRSEEGYVGTSVPAEESVGEIMRRLKNMGDDLRDELKSQDRMTDSLTEQDLTSHIGTSLRKLGDTCWKEALWHQNTSVRIRYTATVAVLTWGAVSNCMHLDIVLGLFLNRQLTIFNSR